MPYIQYIHDGLYRRLTATQIRVGAQNEAWCYTNDRIGIFTAPAFFAYADNVLSRTVQLIQANGTIQGEVFHDYVLRGDASSTITSLAMCYGISRLMSCSWTNYGDGDCLELGEPLLRDTFKGSVC